MQNPELVDRNPNLYDQLRVLKLQKMLEVTMETKIELADHQLVCARDKTGQMSCGYHHRLMEATCLKVA